MAAPAKKTSLNEFERRAQTVTEGGKEAPPQPSNAQLEVYNQPAKPAKTGDTGKDASVEAKPGDSAAQKASEQRTETMEKINQAASARMEEVRSQLRAARDAFSQGFDAAAPEYKKAIELADSRANLNDVYKQRAANLEHSKKLDEQLKKTDNKDPLYAVLVKEQKAALQLEETLKDLQRACGFTRANMGMAMIRSGRITDGQKLVEQAKSLDKEMVNDENYKRHDKALWAYVDATNPKHADIKIVGPLPQVGDAAKTTDAKPGTDAATAGSDNLNKSGNNRPGAKGFVDPFDTDRLKKVDQILGMANSLEKMKGKPDSEKTELGTLGEVRQKMFAYAKTLGVDISNPDAVPAGLRQVANAEIQTSLNAAKDMDRKWLGEAIPPAVEALKKAQTQLESNAKTAGEAVQTALNGLSPQDKVLVDGLDQQIKAENDPAKKVGLQQMKLALLFKNDANKQQQFAGLQKQAVEYAKLEGAVKNLLTWNDSNAIARLQVADVLNKNGHKVEAAKYFQEVAQYNPEYLKSPAYLAKAKELGVQVNAGTAGDNAANQSTGTDKNATQPASTADASRAMAMVNSIDANLTKAGESKTPAEAAAFYKKAIAEADSPILKAESEAEVANSKKILESGKNPKTGNDLTEQEKLALALEPMTNGKLHAAYIVRKQYAKHLIETGNNREALAQLDAAAAKDPEMAKGYESHLLKGSVLQALGQNKSAESELKLAVGALDKIQVSKADYDETMKGLKAQLDAATDTNKILEIRAQIDKVNAMVSQPSRLRQDVAMFYMGQGKFDDADAMFKEARKRDVTGTIKERVLSIDPETKKKLTAETLEAAASENTTEKLKAKGGLASNVLKDIGVNLTSGWVGLAVTSLFPEEKILTGMLAGWGAASGTHAALSHMAGLDSSALKSIGMGGVNLLAGVGGMRVATRGLAAYETGLAEATYAGLEMTPQRMAKLGLNKLQIAEVSMTQQEMSALKAVSGRVLPRLEQIRAERAVDGANKAALGAEYRTLVQELRAAVPERLQGLNLTSRQLGALEARTGAERLETMKTVLGDDVASRKEMADLLAASHSSVSGTKPFRLPFMPEEMPSIGSSKVNFFNAFKKVDQATNLTELNNIAAWNRFRVDAQALGTASLIWNTPQQFAQVANGDINPNTGKPITIANAAWNSGMSALGDGIGGGLTIAGLRRFVPWAGGVASRLAGFGPEVPPSVTPGLVETYMPRFYRMGESAMNKVGKVTEPIKSAGYNYLAKPAMNGASNGYNWMMGDGAFRNAARNSAYLFGPTERVAATGLGSAINLRIANNRLALAEAPLVDAPMPGQTQATAPAAREVATTPAPAAKPPEAQVATAPTTTSDIDDEVPMSME